MIDSLITQTLEHNDIKPLNKIPALLLTEAEKDIIKFINTYVDKHGETPTKERFKKEGYGHYLTSSFSGTPLSDLLEMTLDQKRQDYLLKNVQELQVEVDKTQKVNPNKLKSIYDDLSLTYFRETQTLTSYDRTKFYSTEKPDSLLFGWETIDSPTGGILNGEYGILVARLGVGKSLVAVYLAQKWAKEGKRVLFVPCEMTLDQTIYRIDAFLGGFNPLVFRTKKRYGMSEDYDEEETKILLETYKGLVEIELDKISKNGGEIMFPQQGIYSTKQIDNLIQEKKPDITIIDAVYLMANENNEKGSDWKILKQISNDIKQICIQRNTRIFATTQLKRTGKEMDFNTEDIAYSDAFGQDADLVMAAYKVPARPKQLVLSLLKVRHGSDLGGVELEMNWNVSDLREVAAVTPSMTLEDLDDE